MTRCKIWFLKKVRCATATNCCQSEENENEPFLKHFIWMTEQLSYTYTTHGSVTLWSRTIRSCYIGNQRITQGFRNGNSTPTHEKYKQTINTVHYIWPAHAISKIYTQLNADLNELFNTCYKKTTKINFKTNMRKKIYYGYAILNPNRFYTASFTVFTVMWMSYQLFWQVKQRHRIFGSRRLETAQWSHLQRRVTGTADINVLWM
jgi:hypothetical protein